MKVCMVTDDIYPDFIGGGGVYSGKLTLSLAKLGQQIFVFAPDTKLRVSFWNKFRSVRFWGTSFPIDNPLFLSLVYSLRLRLCSESFDVVHANQLSGFFLTLFKPKNVRVILVSVHHTYYEMALYSRDPVYRIFYRLMAFFEGITFSRADALLFNTPSEEKKVRKWFRLNQPSRVIYLGTDPVKFATKDKLYARALTLTQLIIPQTEKIVLYVGRLAPKKNVDQLIRAVSLLANKGISLVVIGTGRDEKRLITLARSDLPKTMGTVRNVHFLGFVPNLRSYFLAADCFATIGVAEGGVAISTLEAASYGLPLVLSSSDADNPIMAPDKNGVLVDPQNIREIASGIETALKNQKKYGSVSRQMARNLTWAKTAKQTLTYYQELLEKSADKNLPPPKN